MIPKMLFLGEPFLEGRFPTDSPVIYALHTECVVFR